MRRVFALLIPLLTWILFTAFSTHASESCMPVDDCRSVETAITPEIITLHPVEALERLLPNDGLLGVRDYRQVHGEAYIYDAPGGTLIETRPPGEYFVSIIRVQNGYAEVNAGEWMAISQLTPAPISRLGGVMLHSSDMRYPPAWIRRNVRPVAAPGLVAANNTPALIQYTLVRVYATQAVDGEDWALVGMDQWVPLASVAQVTPVARPEGVDTQRWVGVDLAAQVIIAYEGTTPMFAALIATGREESPTEEGLFHVYARFHHRLMSRGNPAEPFFYYMEDVPYTMYFNEHMALHGAYWHDRFGLPQSHGCVNMSLTDAYYVYDFLSAEFDFSDPDDIWPVVYVYNGA